MRALDATHDTGVQIPYDQPDHIGQLPVHGISVWASTRRDLSLADQSFVFAKSSQGDGTDPSYDYWTGKAAAAGIPVGAWHFGTDSDVATQARRFLTVAGDADFFALDLEKDTGAPTSMTHAQAKEFIHRIKDSGRACGLYTYESVGDDFGEDWWWFPYANPDPPPRAWTFWQHSFGRLGGERFHGTADQFAAFLGKAVDVASLDIQRNELHTIGLPDGAVTYDLAGNPGGKVGAAHDVLSAHVVKVHGSDAAYHVVPIGGAGAQTLRLVRLNAANDKGAVTIGGATAAQLATAHDAGFSEAITAAVAAVQAI